MLEGRGDRLLFADADGATDIRDLDRLEEAMKQIAVRVLRGVTMASCVS